MSDKEETFCERYYMDGIKYGLSNYENYHYLKNATAAMAAALVKHLGIEYTDTFCDYGCSRGFLVKALDSHCFAFGKDISRWAISNCHPDVKNCVSNDLEIKPLSYDWICSKDTLEHTSGEELFRVLGQMIAGARKGIFIIVPLAYKEHGRYLRKEDNLDSTHKTAWPIQTWLALLQKLAPDFTVNGSYHIPGLKEASAKVPFSCGFFTLRRNA